MRDMSQQDLINEINRRLPKIKPKGKKSIERNTISHYENNRSRPDIYILKTICEILEVSVDRLLEIRVGDTRFLANEDIEWYSKMGTVLQRIENMEKAWKDPNTEASKIRELLGESIAMNKELAKEADTANKRSAMVEKMLEVKLNSEEDDS